MAKKKVLFLITKSSWGGAQRYVFDLATNIDKEKYEPIVALGGDGELYEKLREAGLQVITIRGLGRNVSLFKDLLASLHIALILIKERPEVFHINSSKVGVLGTLLGRMLFIQNVIFTSHGWAFNEKRPNWQKTIIKTLHWLTVLFSHSTIVVSLGLKKQLNWPLIQNKMSVVHLGRDVGVIRNREDSREILATKVQNNTISLYDHIEDTWIGTIAELHPTKCLHIAIESMAALTSTHPNLRYIIIHDGEERHRLEKLVIKLKLSEHVFFTGTIPGAAQLLPAFDLFILPSRSEALGYVLIEAGQAGVPVIASDVGGIPDIVTTEENGLLVQPENTNALTDAIDRLLKDTELRNGMAAAHKEKSDTFTLTKMITETEQVYETR